MQRAQARQRQDRRGRVALRIATVAVLAGIPAALYFIDWPLSLVAALPLAVVAMYMAVWVPRMRR